MDKPPEAEIKAALELLDACAAKVEAFHASERASVRVALAARRIVRDDTVTDEEVFRRAFAVAKSVISRVTP